MFNFYLFNKSYEEASIKNIEGNLQDLNDLVVQERNLEDRFLKHESIWSVQTADGPFHEVVFCKIEDKQFSNSVLPKMFHAIDSLENEIQTFSEFDQLFKMYNAFYGIRFDGLDTGRCISDKASYSAFRNKNLWSLTSDSFWERRNSLFIKIIFCDGVKNDVSKIGGTYLLQIIAKLKELDKYVSLHWKTGYFNYKDANEKTALNISPESKKTMDQEKYYNQRLFSLPDGRRECFELHIKTGNLRFHFFPEGGIIYVGYIGKHLDTDKYN